MPADKVLHGHFEEFQEDSEVCKSHWQLPATQRFSSNISLLPDRYRIRIRWQFSIKPLNVFQRLTIYSTIGGEWLSHNSI